MFCCCVAYTDTPMQDFVTSKQTQIKTVQPWQQLQRTHTGSHTHSSLTCRERRATKQPLVRSDGCSRKKCESAASPDSVSSGKTGPLTLREPAGDGSRDFFFFFIQHWPSTRQHLNWSVTLGFSNWLICPEDAAPRTKHLVAPGELVLYLILLVAGLPEWQQLRGSVCSFQHSPHQLLVFLWVHWACAVDHSLDFGD